MPALMKFLYVRTISSSLHVLKYIFDILEDSVSYVWSSLLIFLLIFLIETRKIPLEIGLFFL